MITAIDTNVILDVLIPNEVFFEASARALEDAAWSGPLVICDLVYAELCPNFSSRNECDAFLDSNGIAVEALIREALYFGGRTWLSYRRHGGPRTRILADFLVGAHAELQAGRLLSRDRGFYRNLYPGLVVRDPSNPVP